MLSLKKIIPTQKVNLMLLELFKNNAPNGTDACSSIRATAFFRRDGVIPL
jgi:hypothetical protein